MLALALMLGMPAMAQEVDGFAEVRAQAYAGVDADIPLFFVERFRPTFEAPIGERAVLTTTIEAGISQGWRTSKAFTNLIEDEGLSPALADALGGTSYDNEALAISRASDYLSVDRLAVEFYTSKADIRIGRQALNWGSGFAVNPSDPFPEFLLSEPWKPRSGVNAIRVDVPLGDLNGAQLVVASDDLFLHPRLAGRVTVNALNTDWSLVGAWREEVGSGIAGIDIKGTLGVGFWFEGVLHIDGELEVYEELAAGVDYSFPVLEQLIVTVQYYRNGNGQTGSAAPTLFAERKPFEPAFGGRDYVMASVAAGLTQDVSASALWLQNLNDGTAFFVPTLSLAASQSFDLSLAGQIPLSVTGEGGEFRPSAEQLQQDLPDATGGLRTVDLGGLVPDATVILWTRFNF